MAELLLDSVIARTVDLYERLKTDMLNDLFCTDDSYAHTFELAITRGGSPVDLTGCSVDGYFMRNIDMHTEHIYGVVQDGKAVVTLSKPCYAKAGQFSLTVKITSGDVEKSVYKCESSMKISRGDSTSGGGGTTEGGASLTVDGYGNATLTGMTLTVDGYGNALAE